MRKRSKFYKRGLTLALAINMCITMAPLSNLTVQAADADQTPVPVIYFDMEELSDGKLKNIVDGSEYSINGDAVGLSPSIFGWGQAVYFDGTNYIDLGTAFSPEKDYTLAGWVRQDAGAADGQAVFSRGNSGNVADQLAVIVKNEQLYHGVATENGGRNSDFMEKMSAGAGVPADCWNHIAITRQGAEVVYYVNGRAMDTLSISEKGFAASDKHLYVGMDCDGSGNLYARHAYQGFLDELRLYDQALTSDQVRELAQVESPFEIASVANGILICKMNAVQGENPKREDFRLTFTENGKELPVTVTGYEYKEEEKQAVFSFEPLANYQNTEKTVAVSVTYREVSRETELILPAGENKVPVAEEVFLENISPKLGAEPHVKGMLQVNYTFSDADQDTEGETKYQWYLSDTRDGEYTPILGIRTKTVILLDSYVGKYLKCEVTPADSHGNKGTPVLSDATLQPVKDTEGNPLTDWFYEARFGISHHFLSNYFNLGHVYADDSERWDRKNMTWDEFVGQFDAESYAEQVNETGAKYVILTLGQNSGSYCAPNLVYDKYMREAGLLKEGEANPKTVSMENDLPMKMADALGKYNIKLMLYLPSNPPHSASWDETGTPNGYGYFSDYEVTKKVFEYTPGTDGVSTQHGKKVLSEMVEWWSEHYGDKISGWWFDGMYYGGVFESQNDMSNEYNISTLANAAKAGNPYSIVTFNQGLNVGAAFAKSNPYQDYTAGESQGLNSFPVDGRWAKDSDDCQNFIFGPLGDRNNWSAGWGCKGTSRDPEFLANALTTSIRSKYVMGFDTKVNIRGELDPEQFEQLKAVKQAVLDHTEDELTEIQLTEEYTLRCIGDRGILQYSLKPEGVLLAEVAAVSEDPEIVQVKRLGNHTIDVVAVKEGTTNVVIYSTKNPEIKAECRITVEGKEALAVYDDTDAVFVYTGSWAHASNRPADADGFHEYKDTVHYTKENGAKAEITFEGTGFDLIGGYNTDQGEISVQVDGGEPVVVDTSVPGGAPKKSFGLVLYHQDGLEDGTHTITFTKLSSGQYMILDAVRIYRENKIDKTALQNLYEKYQDLTSTGYTQETWKIFKKALNQAKVVLENPDADQAAIDDAAAALEEAANGLRVSKKTLERFLEKAKQHEADRDVEELVESVQRLFAEAIAAGQEVMAMENPSYEQVQNATINLMLAIQSLGMKAGDKTDLIMALEFADTIDLNRYVTAGQAEYLAALETARAVRENGDAFQEEVDAAWEALTEAIANLRLRADKEALADLLRSVKDMDLSLYTEESVAFFRGALAAAQEVMDHQELSALDQQTVDNAVKALAEARDGLVRKPAPEEPENPTAPETPAEPENPTSPEPPAEPENPTSPEPENPSNSENSNAQQNPETPAGNGTANAGNRRPGTNTGLAENAGNTEADREENDESKGGALAMLPEEETPLAEGITGKDPMLENPTGGAIFGALAERPANRNWSLVNLILAVLAAMLSLALLASLFGGRGKEHKTGVILRLASLIPAMGAIALLAATSTVGAAMVMTNRWTTPMLILSAINGVLAVFVTRGVKGQEESSN